MSFALLLWAKAGSTACCEIAPRPTTAYPTGFTLTLPVGAAESLILDRRMLESSQLFNVFERLGDRFDNAVDVFAAPQEQIVGEPDGLVVCGALGRRTTEHRSQVERLTAPPAERREIGGLHRE